VLINPIIRTRTRHFVTRTILHVTVNLYCLIILYRLYTVSNEHFLLVLRFLACNRLVGLPLSFAPNFLGSEFIFPVFVLWCCYERYTIGCSVDGPRVWSVLLILYSAYILWLWIRGYMYICFTYFVLSLFVNHITYTHALLLSFLCFVVREHWPKHIAIFISAFICTTVVTEHKDKIQTYNMTLKYIIFSLHISAFLNFKVSYIHVARQLY
jgi:hypothetical protein